jgi:hypothetical protein
VAIKYSRHAERRLLEREIPLYWVEAVIAGPDRELVDTNHSGPIRGCSPPGEAGGGMLQVAWRKRGTDVVVVTAFRTAVPDN